MTHPHPPLDYNQPSPPERRAALRKTLRRWFLRSTLTLLILAALAFAIDQLWVWLDRRISIATGTTRILSPIEPNGRPDYLAAINAHCSAGITPQNNAAPLLLQVVGTDEFSPARQSSTHKLLDLAPAPFPRTFITLAESNHTLSGSTTKPSLDEQSATMDEETAAAAAPWNPADHPQWAAWVKANSHTLDLLQAASDKPRYYMPTLAKSGAPSHLADDETFIFLVLPAIGRYRDVAHLPLARAMMNLQTKNAPAFQADILATAKLARLLAQGPTLIEYLVATAIDGSVNTALQAAASSQLLTADQLEQLYQQILSLPPFPPPTEQLDFAERYGNLDVICKLARIDDDDDPNNFNLRTIPVNFDRCLRIANADSDGMVAAFAQPTHTARHSAMSALSASITPRYTACSRIERAVLALVLNDFSGAEKLLTTNRANRNLALTALALRAHKLNTGNFPPTLTALPPAAAPHTLDPWSESPLIYRPDAQGYLLYSLGPNQRDDAGTPRTPTGPASQNYDIVLHTPQ